MPNEDSTVKHSIVNFEVNDRTLNMDIDSNRDGEKVLRLSLRINEALKEAMDRGNAVEGAKIATVNFEGKKLVISIDSDKDGEPMLVMDIDLMEAFDEIKDRVI